MLDYHYARLTEFKPVLLSALERHADFLTRSGGSRWTQLTDWQAVIHHMVVVLSAISDRQVRGVQSVRFYSAARFSCYSVFFQCALRPYLEFYHIFTSPIVFTLYVP